MLKKWLTNFTVVLLLDVLLPIPAHAVAPSPASFYGIVMNAATGQPATGEATVIALIGEQTAGKTTTFSFQGSAAYRLDVLADDPDTAVREGGREGETIIFLVDGQLAGQAKWQMGANAQANLEWTPPMPEEPPFAASIDHNVTDVSGMVLWYFNNNPSNWFADAVFAVRPTYYTGNPEIPINLNNAKFASAIRNDGVKQITYRGWLICDYTDDTVPGDIDSHQVNTAPFVLDPAVSAAPVHPRAPPHSPLA